MEIISNSGIVRISDILDDGDHRSSKLELTATADSDVCITLLSVDSDGAVGRERLTIRLNSFSGGGENPSLTRALVMTIREYAKEHPELIV